MGKVGGEEDFPRGTDSFPGDRRVHRRKKPKSDNLFRVHQNKNVDDEDTQKKINKKKKNKSNDNLHEKVIIEPISLETLAVGQIVMACIQTVGDYELKMVLPGGVIVIVPIYNICDVYTEAIEAFMNEDHAPRPLKPQSMFEPGQCFPVKIIQKDDTDMHEIIRFIGTMNPSDLHADIVPTNYISFVGKVPISAAVISVEDHGYVMDIGFGENLKGFLSREDAQPHMAESNVLKRTELPVGYLLRCIGVSVSGRIVKLTTKTKNLNKKVVGDEDDGILALNTAIPGTRMSLRIMGISDQGLQVIAANEHDGFVARNHLSSEWELPKANYQIGQIVEGRVLYTTYATKRLALTLRPLPEPGSTRTTWEIGIGHLFEKATVISKDEIGNIVLKSGKYKLFAPKSLLSDSFNGSEDHSTIDEQFPTGTKLKARVKLISYIDGYVRVSLKKSVTEIDTIDIDDVEIGKILKGSVQKFFRDGLIVQLGYRLKALIPLIHLSDTAVQHPERLYPLNKEVTCRIRKVDYGVDPVRIVATAKKSLLDRRIFIFDSYSKATPGQEVVGVICMQNESGSLVEFFNNVRGWLPTRFMEQHIRQNPGATFPIGQTIKCYVHNFAMPDRVTLTMRPKRTRTDTNDSQTTAADNKADSANNAINEPIKPSAKKKGKIEQAVGNDSSTETKNKLNEHANELSAGAITKNGKNKQRTESECSEQTAGSYSSRDCSKALPTESSEPKKSKKGARGSENHDTPQEQLSAASEKSKRSNDSKQTNESFVWDAGEATKALLHLEAAADTAADKEAADSVDADVDDKTARKKSRTERNQEARRREQELRNSEARLADSSSLPETAADYERLVLGAPNNSLVWIKYISYLLEQNDIAGAREIAERALKTISFREENEKLNVWIAYLNLEHLYGTADSLDNVLERALQFNDPLKVYQHMASMYSAADKTQEAEAMYETMMKKFKQDKSVWINYGLFCMKQKRLEEARKLMQRSFQSLDKRHHIDIISKFGQLEFSFGETERGKTMFESLLVNYPKRVDLWNIYLDMLVKYTLRGTDDDIMQALQSIRSVFERAVSLKLPAKKVQTLFKKYIDFEISYGNESTVALVKQKQLEYTEASPLLQEL